MAAKDFNFSQADLQACMHYDPETGVFTRLENMQINPRVNKHLIGKEAGRIQRLKNRKTPYRIIAFIGNNIKAHQLAWFYMTGSWPPDGYEIDHINGDGLDNRISNLRLLTRSENQFNIKHHAACKSGTIGVTWVPYRKDGGGKWRAMLVKDYKNVHLGYFDNYQDAVKARIRGEQEHFPGVKVRCQSM